MNILFYFNPESGNTGVPVDAIRRSFEEHGATVYSQDTKDDTLTVPNLNYDLIVIAGGDGTVEKIALSGRIPSLPLAILSYGSANNISLSLGLSYTYEELIPLYKNAKTKQLSVGKVLAPSGQRYFIESVGWGLFTEVLLAKHIKNKEVGKDGQTNSKVAQGAAAIYEASLNLPAWELDIRLDGEDYSGSYLWVEVMNTRMQGPRLLLAPEADPSDLYLDVMLVREDERETLIDYLYRHKDGDATSPFTLIKAKSIWVRSQLPYHVDDEVVESAENGAPEAAIEISLTESHLKIIVD